MCKPEDLEGLETPETEEEWAELTKVGQYAYHILARFSGKVPKDYWRVVLNVVNCCVEHELEKMGAPDPNGHS